MGLCLAGGAAAQIHSPRLDLKNDRFPLVGVTGSLVLAASGSRVSGFCLVSSFSLLVLLVPSLVLVILPLSPPGVNATPQRVQISPSILTNPLQPGHFFWFGFLFDISVLPFSRVFPGLSFLRVCLCQILYQFRKVARTIPTLGTGVFLGSRRLLF